MQVKAHAKMNWTLDIVGTRADGYHLLDMLLQSLEVHDVLTFEKDDGLSLSIDGNEQLAKEQNNLVLKAANALNAYCKTKHGAKITLEKHIPTGAGLGGGSADAATTLLALNTLWALELSMEELAQIGLTLGADVPYCLEGGAKRVRGIGERITSFSVDRTYWVILVKPCEGLSTKDVFQKADELASEHPNTSACMDALAIGDMALLSKNANNALLPAATFFRKEVTKVLEVLKNHGANFTAMTGSGCVVYGIYKKEEIARQAISSIKQQYDTVFLTKTI